MGPNFADIVNYINNYKPNFQNSWDFLKNAIILIVLQGFLKVQRLRVETTVECVWTPSWLHDKTSYYADE